VLFIDIIIVISSFQVCLLEVDNHFFPVINANLMLTSIRKTHRLRSELRKGQKMPEDRFCRPEVKQYYKYCWKCQTSSRTDVLKISHREMCSSKSIGRLVMPAEGNNILKYPSSSLITPYHYYGVFDSEAICRPRKGNYHLVCTYLKTKIYPIYLSKFILTLNSYSFQINMLWRICSISMCIQRLVTHQTPRFSMNSHSIHAK
jgi:hypothetical protein